VLVKLSRLGIGAPRMYSSGAETVSLVRAPGHGLNEFNGNLGCWLRIAVPAAHHALLIRPVEVAVRDDGVGLITMGAGGHASIPCANALVSCLVQLSLTSDQDRDVDLQPWHYVSYKTSIRIHHTLSAMPFLSRGHI